MYTGSVFVRDSSCFSNVGPELHGGCNSHAGPWLFSRSHTLQFVGGHAGLLSGTQILFYEQPRLPIHLPGHPICISARLSGGALQTRRRHHHNLARRGSSRRKSSCRQPLVPRLRSRTEGHHHQLFLIATSGLLSFSERPMVEPLFRPDAMPSHSREPRYCWGSSFATRMQHLSLCAYP